MPYAPGTTTTPAPPPRRPARAKPQPQATPAGSSADRLPSQAPSLAALPAGPPVRALQKYGIHITVAELNERVQQIHDAHERNFGFRPKPGLVFDLLRADPGINYDELLGSVPHTRRQAQARRLARQAKPEEITGGIATEAFELPARRNPYKPSPQEQRQAAIELERLHVEAAGTPAVIGEKIASGLGHLGRGLGQIALGLTFGPPTLVYEEAKGVKASVEQRSLKPLGETQVALGKAVVEGVKEDVRHPWENWGYLTLDILGATAGGAGAAARVGAAGKALRAEGAKAAVARPTARGGSLAHRPPAGRTVLRYGDLKVEALNSENPALRPLQLGIRRLRERAANKRFQTDENLPADAVTVPRPGRIAGLLERSFSFEAKIRRELDKQARLERQLGLLVRDDLLRVAGWSERITKTMAHLPQSTRRGLTRGEQMALMVETLDDPHPLLTMRQFHQDKIEEGPGPWKSVIGEVAEDVWAANHEQKLRDLRMAEKVLANPEKQTRRFRQALALVQQADAEMTALKIAEAGLLEETALGRVVKAGEVFRSGKPIPAVGKLEAEIRKLEGLLAAKHVEGRAEAVGPYNAIAVERKIERLQREVVKAKAKEGHRGIPREGATYMPFIAPEKIKRLAKDLFRGVRVGRWGFAKQELRRNFPEVHHEFTGKAIVAGDYMIDATRLMADAVGSAVQGAFRMSQYKELLKTATATPRSAYDRPMLKPEADGWPDDLKRILNRTDEGQITAQEVGGFSKHDWDKMTQAVFPGRKNERTGLWEPTIPSTDVVWVDERIVSPAAFAQPMPSRTMRVAQTVQDIYRLPALHLKPSYAFNLISNEGVAMIMQGPLAPWRFAKALVARKLYGEEVYRTLAETVGVGRFGSYIDDVYSSKASRRAAHFWNRFTDQEARISTGLYYGEKLGYKTKEDWQRLVREARRDRTSKAFQDLLEIKERTNKAMVQFDNLTWFEQSVMRHIIFVYPWRRGQVIWSLRTILEKPIKADVIAHIGAQGAEDFRDVFSDQVEDWIKKAGFLVTRFDGSGNPLITNPSTLHTWGDLGSIIQPDFERSLGPVVSFFVRGVKGEDEFGNEYPDQGWAQWAWAALDVMSGLPQVRAYERGKASDGALPPIEIKAGKEGRETYVRRLNAALEQTVFTPGWLRGYGYLITGPAFTERGVNKLALRARWYHNLPDEQKFQVFKTLVQQGMKLQADLLGKPIPRRVQSAVDLYYAKAQFVSARENETGRDLTPAERTAAEIDFFQQQGLIPKEDLDDLRGQVPKLADSNEHEQFRANLFESYGDPDGALATWDSDVRRVAALASPRKLNRRLKVLASERLLAGSASKTSLAPDKLAEYGRKVLGFVNEKRERLDRLFLVGDPVEAPREWAEYRAWLDANDKPITVAGTALPSAARVEWAALSEDQRDRELARRVARSKWSNLSSFDKELLGKKTSAQAAEAWAVYKDAIASYQRSQPYDQRTLKRDQLVGIARQVNKAYPGFIRDWQFDQQPLYQRLQELAPYRESANKADWQWLFDAAQQLHSAVRAETLGSRDAGEVWADFVRQTRPWIAQNLPAFDRELSRYEEHDSRFLYKFLKR